MSALLANRVQSAYPRTSYRSAADGTIPQQRPTTSMGTHQAYGNALNQAALRTLEQSTLNPPRSAYRRPKTASTISTFSRPSTKRKLRTDEIETLLKSLDQEEPFVAEVDCLADYRTLVQTIDLRQTPLDCQLLCALQQRENRIVQKNACRDTRFLSLLDVLEPSHYRKSDEESTEINDQQRTVVSDYTTMNSFL